MRNYEEMTKRVVYRINDYKTHKKRTIKRNFYITAAAASLCIATLACFLTLGNGLSPKTDDNQFFSDYSYTYTPELRARIKELKAQGDKIGWIYYYNSIYSQSQGLCGNYVDSLVLGEMIGHADEFTGAYEKNPPELSGEIYKVVGQSNLLVIKLNNGGTVVLMEE